LMSFINSGLSVLFIFIISVLTIALLMPKIRPANPMGVIFLFATLGVIGIFIYQKFATAWAVWTFGKNGINVEWSKPFAFRKNEPFTILWSDIKSCEKFRGTRVYSSNITIETKTDIYNFYLLNSFKNNDYDYEIFFKDLKENLELNNLSLD
jgi:hypothetical protein